MQLIFVFGTLKRGFPLHATLRDAAYLGFCRTAKAFPMYVAGGVFGPMMIDRPGRGLRIIGELYDVTAEQLAAVDKVEATAKPGNFRKPVEVITTAHQRLEALAFFKHPRLARPRASGYLAEYWDRRFLPPRQRPASLPTMHLLSEVVE